MSGKEVPTLEARRTPEIEEILQNIWELKPAITGKSKLTIYLSLCALARELRDIPRLSSAVIEASTATTYAEETQQTDATDTQKLSAEEPTISQKADNVSDDVEWDD